jgi:hypothetical protein
LIFIERDAPLDEYTICRKLDVLEQACATEDDELARAALMEVVPTYKKPEEVNIKAEQTVEMKNRRKLVTA